MFHEGWVGPDGNLLLITVDGPWDLNLVGGVNAEMPPINEDESGPGHLESKSPATLSGTTCRCAFAPACALGGVHGWPFRIPMMYWAAATAVMANARENASCLRAVMPRTVARRGRRDR